MDDAVQRLERLRWPGGVRCPGCGSADTASSGTRRRCRGCRTPFCWSTRTGLHATKLPAELWLRAAEAPVAAPEHLAEILEVSVPTARRVAALLDAAPADAGNDPDGRLRHLLASAPPRPRRAQRRLAGRSPDTAPLDAPPRLARQVQALTAGERRVINALRHRPFGATARTLAGLSGVSLGHTRRCLGRIEGLGWIRRRDAVRSWGYAQLRLREWKLDYSDGSGCAQMLGLLRRSAVRVPPEDRDMVPAEFWLCFWSGAPANELRISSDGLLIAETLIGGTHPSARLWALSALPAPVLQQCRTLRGFDTGDNAADIDAALAGRCG